MAAKNRRREGTLNPREHKRAEEAQRLLIDELNHHIENALGTAGKPVDDIAHALSARGVPFVFVTGYDRDALPAGFYAAPIVEKPFTQEQVIAALERLFARAHPG